MRVRTWALGLLVAIGVLPLAGFGALAITRWEATARDEVQAGHTRLAHTVAERIEAYLASQRKKLLVIGQAVTLSKDPEIALNAFAIEFRTLFDLSVHATDGHRLAGPSIDPGADAERARLLERAGAGHRSMSGVRPADPSQPGPFAHTVVLAEPIAVAGRREGAIIARLDLVELWRPIHSIEVGQTGFVRLAAADGTTLAHGNPADRREVFAGTQPAGPDTLTASAKVPGTEWTITVEQAASEALAQVWATRDRLLIIGAATLVLAIFAALVLGRRFVRGLEALGAHTDTLGHGDLTARIDHPSGIVEVDALGAALDTMAASLLALQIESTRRERVTAFGRVAAGLTHDLRQPIETIRTACIRLSDAPDDPDARELFSFMLEHELPRLVRHLRDLRQLAGAGEVEVSTDSVKLPEFLAELRDELSRTPKWHGVSFSVEPSAGQVDGDRDLLRRAVRNLAANAADACVGSAGAVTLSSHASDEHVEIAVADTGDGLDAEALESVLSGDLLSSKRSNGIGLGLGVVAHVAQLHGGALSAESTPGQGSTFRLRLPAHPRAEGRT